MSGTSTWKHQGKCRLHSHWLRSEVAGTNPRVPPCRTCRPASTTEPSRLNATRAHVGGGRGILHAARVQPPETCSPTRSRLCGSLPSPAFLPGGGEWGRGLPTRSAVRERFKFESPAGSGHNPAPPSPTRPVLCFCRSKKFGIFWQKYRKKCRAKNPIDEPNALGSPLPSQDESGLSPVAVESPRQERRCRSSGRAAGRLQGGALSAGGRASRDGCQGGGRNDGLGCPGGG